MGSKKLEARIKGVSFLLPASGLLAKKTDPDTDSNPDPDLNSGVDAIE